MNKQPVSYLQTDKRWKDKRYPCNGGTMSIGGGGCGPTSCAMLIETLTGKPCPPTEAMDWICKHGYMYANQGTSYDAFRPIFNAYGIEADMLTWTQCMSADSPLRLKVRSMLMDGYYFIALMKKGLWTNGGHYVVVWWADNKIRINDPASTKTERLNGDPDTFFSQAKYFWSIDARDFNKKKSTTMNYYTQNGVDIVEVPVSQFKITMVNQPKKSLNKTNYCNANFFATFAEGTPKTKFTLPVGHLVCDFNLDLSNSANKYCEHYCRERGSFNGSKFIFDASKWKTDNVFSGKALTTLLIKNNKATIEDIVTIPNDITYGVTGIPIMLNKTDVSWNNYVKKQGWDGSELYATSHIFIGLKEEPTSTIYVMGWTSKTANLISSAEAYKVFRNLGFRDVIKLDGGGSYYLNAGTATRATNENRQINAIIEFAAAADIKCPYTEPTITLKKGSVNSSGVKWVQWWLNQKGYTCAIDGSFGPSTDNLVRQFQKDRKLVVDGSVGPATRKALKE